MRRVLPKCAVVIWGVMTASTAWSQSLSDLQLGQASAARQTAYVFYQQEPAKGVPAAKSPFVEEPAATDDACDTCETCDAACDCDSCRGCGGWALPQPSALYSRGITIGGWLEAGISAASPAPADRNLFPVAFNDRQGEGQMNQLWVYMERTVDTGGYGWDIGGRVDFLYGTDARFVQTRDIEGEWNQTERFYQVALPQFYLDVAYNNLTIRMGHFLGILGYETTPAPDNFFYSHSYAMLYAEPYTHTGLLGIYDVNDQLTFCLGFQNALDQIEGVQNSKRLGLLAGANWSSWNGRVSIDFAVSTAKQRPVVQYDGSDIPPLAGFVYSVVGTVVVTDRLSYVIQHDYVQGVLRDVPQLGTRKSEAYGVNQYLFYEINPCWAAGLRFEWFRDDDGFYVWNRRNGEPIQNFFAGGLPGNFYEVSAGVNWTPRENIIVRPEARWDWFDGTATPFDVGTRKDQFTFACDLILTY